jgi:Tol biopolymer transport system component
MTALIAGSRLGPYEIVEQVGAGGMGEVYKATDTRLDRSVAIKVLPDHWADNPDMKQRFEREAQTIASLNHPNICVLHDIGRQDPSAGSEQAAIDYLVLEYLEGETLGRRLERGALGVDEALKIGIAIADALDKAHRQGVVHRDLKPSNVMLTGSGPKLLDFGLAKWTPSHARSGALSHLPTVSDLTTPGAVLGTLQYMAPEQLEGIEADARTDIFAFGALLHEMVTGKKAFEGKSQVLLMAAIATTHPQPLSQTQPDTPAALDHVVKTCLAKDPKDRWQTARDLLAELEWIAQGGGRSVIPAVVPAARRKRERLVRLVLATAALFAATMAWPAVLYLRGPGDTDELRFRVPIAWSAQTGSGNPGPVIQGAFAISPDGRAIAYVTQGPPPDPLALFVRPLGSVTPQRLAGTDGAAQPFWSADSRSIAFVAGGRLKKIDASGGPPQDICETAEVVGGAWNSGGTILFGSAKGVFRVSAQGGKPEPVTTLDSTESGHYWPHFLPDGRHFLYLAWSGEPSNRAVFAGTLDSKDKTRILAAESKAAFAEPGYLLFRRADAVYAQPFGARTLTLSSEPVRVADRVPFNTSLSGQGSFAVSQNGALVYYSARASVNSNTGPDGFDRQLAWANRTGQVVETPGPPGAYRGLAASPDGTRIAVHRHDGAGGDIFVVEPRGAVTQLTFEASRDHSSPVWSPDGKRIVYGALQKGKWGLYQRLSDGSGTEELLFESQLPSVPMSWAPDAKRIVFWAQDSKTGGDLWVLPLEGDKKPAPLVATAFNETHGQVSPDGKWIAYTSNSTGGRNEIFVQPFPSGSGLWRVSTQGGAWPRWSRDGKELFYHALHSAGSGPSETATLGPFYAATVNARGATFEAGPPREILNTLALSSPHSGGDYHIHDVSPDGQRFLLFQVVVTSAGAAAEIEPDPPAGLIVALHWTSALARK